MADGWASCWAPGRRGTTWTMPGDWPSSRARRSSPPGPPRAGAPPSGGGPRGPARGVGLGRPRAPRGPPGQAVTQPGGCFRRRRRRQRARRCGVDVRGARAPSGGSAETRQGRTFNRLVTRCVKGGTRRRQKPGVPAVLLCSERAAGAARLPSGPPARDPPTASRSLGRRRLVPRGTGRAGRMPRAPPLEAGRWARGRVSGQRARRGAGSTGNVAPPPPGAARLACEGLRQKSGRLAGTPTRRG